MSGQLNAFSDSHAIQEALDERAARHSRLYQCRCGNIVFFGNTQCLACQSQLG